MKASLLWIRACMCPVGLWCGRGTLDDSHLSPSAAWAASSLPAGAGMCSGRTGSPPEGLCQVYHY